MSKYYLILVTLIFITRYACLHHFKHHCLIKTHQEKKSKNEIKTSNKIGMINNFVVSIYDGEYLVIHNKQLTPFMD